MSTASVSIARTSLSLAALVVADDGATYRLSTFGRPGVTWRMTAMADSVDVHGTEYLAAAREQTSFPLELLVTAASSSALDTACVALEAALSQFSYAVTVTVDGVAKTWSASPASWSAGPFDSGEVAAHMCVYAVSIPVYPIAS